jgi:SAM-dependent methyltransferase
VAGFTVAVENYNRFMGRYAIGLAPKFVDAAGVRAGMRVLDVGCGPGALAVELAGRVGEGNVAAIDPAAQFAAACQARIPGADVREGVAESRDRATSPSSAMPRLSRKTRKNSSPMAAHVPLRATSLSPSGRRRDPALRKDVDPQSPSGVTKSTLPYARSPTHSVEAKSLDARRAPPRD